MPQRQEEGLELTLREGMLLMWQQKWSPEAGQLLAEVENSPKNICPALAEGGLALHSRTSRRRRTAIPCASTRLILTRMDSRLLRGKLRMRHASVLKRRTTICCLCQSQNLRIQCQGTIYLSLRQKPTWIRYSERSNQHGGSSTSSPDYLTRRIPSRCSLCSMLPTWDASQLETQISRQGILLPVEESPSKCDQCPNAVAASSML